MDDAESNRAQRPRLGLEGEASLSQPLSVGLEDDTHESMLAKTMSSLTFEEQQVAIHDLHGVSEIAEDDPIMIDEKLVEMEVELSKISSKNAYLLAKEISPDYGKLFNSVRVRFKPVLITALHRILYEVCNRELRLLFLRSDVFNSRNAAIRFVKFFAVKLRLFGREKVGNDIRLSDLGPEELDFGRLGGSRWLPHRDRAGRAVLFVLPNMSKRKFSVDCRFRALLWSFFNALRDKETQRKGLVLVLFNVGSSSSLEPEVLYHLREMVQSIPLRLIGFHICYDNPMRRPLISLLIAALDKFITARCRSHFGTATECIYELMTFGIPREAIPITDDGQPIVEGPFGPLERATKRLEQEKLPPPKELLIFIPGPFDVLLGRQKLCQDHIGNLRYRHLILSYQAQYEVASKQEKTVIAERIVKEVHRKGGHFLTEYFADYIEVADIVARKKVAHAFRSQRKIQNRKKGRQDQETISSSVSPPKQVSKSHLDVDASSKASASKAHSEGLTTMPGGKRSFTECL
eukprot:scaffold824_cov129-Cylindrotheca_fusiformis.AAC.3